MYSGDFLRVRFSRWK